MREWGLRGRGERGLKIKRDRERERERKREGGEASGGAVVAGSLHTEPFPSMLRFRRHPPR